jgi:hypothetical protein
LAVREAGTIIWSTPSWPPLVRHANSRVEVLDFKTGKPVGAVLGMKSSHGIALDSNSRQAMSATARVILS